MGLTDIFWIFLIISALQPFLQKKMLEMSRLRLLRSLEKKRGSLVIALIHRQETMSLLGFPLVRYIDVNDSEEVLRAIRLCDPECSVDMIIHTPGGLVLAADQIVQILATPAKAKQSSASRLQRQACFEIGGVIMKGFIVGAPAGGGYDTYTREP